MKLETYLSQTGMKPSAFAAELGVPASTITRILRGERSPSLGLMAVIREKTGGLVQPNDFLPAPTPTEAQSRPAPAEAAE